ncbi:MAG: VOC family protein [Anaerolineae bacterium]|jgi:uncharacterized protein|nr:VOC family protein [Anaerolineae bacterium]MBT7070282.1 VOC family protein [Anaerolineae bacterium]MBT7325485.1 VOC family protein [Anaerolineae bacterium]
MVKRNIVHIEIPTKDAATSGKFYADLFGWKIKSMPEMNYTMFEPSEGPGGGFSEVTAENPVGKVLIYVDSADIDADLKEAEALGGKIIMPKSEIPETGWFGIFEDPTGNHIALYTSMNP